MYTDDDDDDAYRVICPLKVKNTNSQMICNY